MPIWIEALLGLAAVALCAVACWHEEKLIALEERIAQAVKERISVSPTGETITEGGRTHDKGSERI